MPNEDPTTSVEYREIARFPAYRFGIDGTIWSRWKRGKSRKFQDTWRLIKASRYDRFGHVKVGIFDGSRCHQITVHRLILEAFVGPCPPGLECRHLNGKAGDNRLENLAWGTKAENQQDKVRHGTNLINGPKPRGVDQWCAKLNDESVVEIRRLRKEGHTYASIGARFGVTKSCIRFVTCGQSWKHIAS